MIDWKSNETLMLEVKVMQKLAYIFMGLYTWEVVTSLQLERDLLSGRRKFKWPMIFYFLCRYFTVLFLAAFIARTEAPLRPVHCVPIRTLMHFAGLCSLALSSFILSLRTLALWGSGRNMKIFVVAVFIGYLALIAGMSPYAFRVDWSKTRGCTTRHPPSLTGVIIVHMYNLSLDLLFLGLTLYKIAGAGKTTIVVRPKRRQQAGHLAYVLFSQGMSYYTITTLLNILSTVFYILNLNDLLAVIVSTPAIVLIPLLACRMVRGLTYFGDQDVKEEIRFSTVNTSRTLRAKQSSSRISSVRFGESEGLATFKSMK